MRGAWDEGAKTLRLKGMQTDPVTGSDTSLREDVHFPDDNTQVYTLYGDMGGKEMKMMEMTFKRK